MRRTLAALAASILVLTLAAPAQAGTRGYRDKKGDASGGNDIVKTTITNGKRITVTVKHKNLNRKAVDIQFKLHSKGGGNNWTAYGVFGQGVTIYDADFDTHKCKGAKASRKVGASKTVISVPRSCFNSPTGKISVAPRVQWSQDGSKGDWSFNKHHHFSPRVPR